MFAAASGNSTLGIPRKVGEEFVGKVSKDADTSSELPSAAGVMLTDPDGRVLFLRRSGEGDHPGEWCWPGGGADPGETPEEAARREVEEETGHRIDGDLSPVDHSEDDVDFHTFAHQLPQRFQPHLNEEHSAHVWAHPSKPPQPLHPGVADTLSRLSGAQDAEGNKGNPQGALSQQEEAEAAKGHAEREEMPESVFLEPGARKYPVKEKHDGKWVYSRNLLLAAARRARMQGHESLAARADAIRNREFGDAEAKDCSGTAMDAMAFDRSSVRSYDADGRLHVSATPISKSNVCEYLGREIPGAEELHLDPSKRYRLWRHPEELAKAAPTFNNIPVLSRHVPVSAEDYQPEIVIGSTGTDAVFDEPYLKNSLVIWAKSAIDGVERETKKELSSAYRYKADMTSGKTPDGEAFDGIMRSIVGNHVAVVPDGRAGPDVVVADSADELLWARIEQALNAAFPNAFR
jgi:8-oxo-dGTP pyrophosphatase MutT (NUDIX family)